MKRIALLTSSRADYSLYCPLIKELSQSSDVTLDVIAFGSHLSKKYGYTLELIRKDGLSPVCVETPILGGEPTVISRNIGSTVRIFSSFWAQQTYDLIICLGDRYEMYAAVLASVPYNLPVAHIAGGETTMGAIDEKFRHSLSIFSQLHFTSAEVYKNKVAGIIGSNSGVYNTGSLSIDNLSKLELLTVQEFKQKFDIDLLKPTILVTFHPETVNLKNNSHYLQQLIQCLQQLTDYQIVTTMPNADTMGDMIRRGIRDLSETHAHVIAVENFGTIGYLSCMKHCAMMLGNTSSGFVEAAYFPKYVINIGDRQTGRFVTNNIFNTPIECEAMLFQVRKIQALPPSTAENPYGDGSAARRMSMHILDYLNK
ncbi:UDP-N-acetylglucosamine 2-epimerase [Thalassospira xianhensis]|uniref:UDP-N-acetyl-D-glucosamine 2-epimerase n=1 Tax=Thalassospira xianhensis MCCC 1A02616 TaxID=1177929 RepID=A0A367UJT4_9PROT|nr:UDP-N-acetylglucosamine 2-epimerase [Thalassospira xianhensis]RCK07372.1 UDP-N-acetyl-D-glucosamine 2-epimerase [Thalassospira xianhensis MCCC 1A02616]